MSWKRFITAVAVLAALAACTTALPPEVDQSAARYAALRDACLQTSPTDRADTVEQKARIAACSDVISSDKTSAPDLTAALKMRAGLYALTGNYADAAKDYAEVVRLNPRDAPTLKVLGDAYRRLGRCALATASHDRAIRLNPKFAAAFEARADAALCLKDTSHAIEDLNQAIQLEPRSPDLYTKRGALHMQLGEETAAIHDFSQALLLRPRDVAALLGRGDAYFKLAKYAEALTNSTARCGSPRTTKTRSIGAPRVVSSSRIMTEQFRILTRRFSFRRASPTRSTDADPPMRASATIARRSLLRSGNSPQSKFC